VDSLGNKTIMAENIVYYMQRDGIDRNTLSKLVGAPYTTVSDWINAKTYPRIDKIERMAQIFGVTKSALVEKRPANIVGEPEAMIEKVNRLLKQVPDDRRDEILHRIEALLKSQGVL
jgi:transcriptional regulator with XRE-family HTH domain